MKKTLTILAVAVVCCIQACHKQQEFIASPIVSESLTTEDSNLISRIDSLEREVLAEMYYSSLSLKKMGRVVIKPVTRPVEAMRASDAINQ